MNLYTDFLGENATLDTVCDHVLHWLDLGGAKHIALGGDPSSPGAIRALRLNIARILTVQKEEEEI